MRSAIKKKPQAALNPKAFEASLEYRRLHDPASIVTNNEYHQMLEDTRYGTREPVIATLLRGDYYDVPASQRVAEVEETLPGGRRHGRSALRFQPKMYVPTKSTPAAAATAYLSPRSGAPRTFTDDAATTTRDLVHSTQGQHRAATPSYRHRHEVRPSSASGRRATTNGSVASTPRPSSASGRRPSSATRPQKTAQPPRSSGTGGTYGVISESEMDNVKRIMREEEDKKRKKALEGENKKNDETNNDASVCGRINDSQLAHYASNSLCAPYATRRRYISRPNDQFDIIS